MIAAEQKMTWKEFQHMEIEDNDLALYELLDGVPTKRPPTNLLHQRVSGRLTFELGTFMLQNPVGKFFHAPLDVYLDDYNAVIPDILFVSNQHTSLLENGEYVAGAPDLIVEIISPGSVKRDRVEKMQLYEKFAVKEFWLVDPQNRTVEVFVMKDDAFALHAFLEIEGKLTSTVLTGFEMEIKELFV